MVKAKNTLRVFFFLVLCCLAVNGLPSRLAYGQEGGGLASAVKRTGLPVPRWASLRMGEVNMRTGPGIRYPVAWVYHRKGLPVEIIAEFDTWRRIRDVAGDSGWVHQAALSGKRMVLVKAPATKDQPQQELRSDNKEDAHLRAILEAGVQAQLVRCDETWCKINANNVQGYIHRSALWGIYPQEKLD